MKKAIILTAIMALLRSGFASMRGDKYSMQHDGQLIYELADEVQERGLAEYFQRPLDTHTEQPLGASPHPLADDQKPIYPYQRQAVDQYDSSSPESRGDASGDDYPTTRSQWAMVYFPYNEDSTCKSLLTVRSDIARIARKGFTSVRLHASDCNALYTVGEAALLHQMKLILGIQVDDGTGAPGAEAQIEELITWAQGNWERVEMIVVGEESIFNEYVLPAQLADLIASVRETLRAAGYHGPITTTEPIPTLRQYAAVLCPVIDIPAANIHPFFHSEVSFDSAGSYVAYALSDLGDICPGKPEAVNLETGWPSRGAPNGRAVPGRVEQMVAVQGIMRNAGGRSVVLGFGVDEGTAGGALG
ncbi:MAG: hypothetical protein Q9163_001976, partial [Psora crenata]